MKLYFNHASPFSRKARIIIHELKINQIEQIDTGLISPVESNYSVIKLNPIGKVPVLVRDDETPLTDSRVICEYLDSQVSGKTFFPTEPGSKYRALHLQALADDLLTTVVATKYERINRPRTLRWTEWINRQSARINRTIDFFNARLKPSHDSNTIGGVTIACALGYVDFRELDPSWRQRNPELSNWFAEFRKRPSIRSTKPTV